MVNKKMESSRLDPLYKKYLLEAGARAGLEFTAKEEEQLLYFISYLLEQNKIMDLTNITDPEELAIKHFLDSWMLLPFLAEIKGKITLADIGSGAGFPGLALKIIRPDLKMTLIDARAKRVDFLNTIIRELDLKDIRALHLRAEEAGRDLKFRDSFAIVTARAVAALPQLLELCLPLVAVGGFFLAMKAEAKAEIKESASAVAQLSGKLRENYEFKLPGTEIKRSIIKIEKIKKTSEIFPRSFAQIKNKPLK